ncbi:hypothetical protein N9Y92_01295 [Chlamydiales bacterium]|nr:hypothetical protein [Chlamydiales bacterium]
MDDFFKIKGNDRPPEGSKQTARVEPKKKDRDKFKESLVGKEDKVEEEEGSKESIFDFSKKDVKKKKNLLPVKEEKQNAEAKDDPFDVTKLVKDETKDSLKPLEDQPEIKSLVAHEKGTIVVVSDKKVKGDDFDLSQETRPDLAQVNPTGEKGGIVGAFGKVVETHESKSLARKDSFEIAQQMIDKMDTMKMNGETDTVVTLKHPPLFKGAQITVKEFSQAKGEFNIAFENLSPQAKHLIDLRASQDSLVNTLSQKGYVIHIVTTNVDIENKISDGEIFAGKDDQQEGEKEGKGKQDRGEKEG